MTDGVQIALIVLLALLVGALLPLLVSAFSLIKQAKHTLGVLEERAGTLTVSTDKVLGRVESIAEGVQEELPTLRRTSQRVDELGTSIERLTETVHKIQAAGQILGPAIAAGLNAYRAVRQNQPAVDVDDSLPEAVTDAILDEIKAQAEANGDLEAPADDSKDAPAKTTNRPGHFQGQLTRASLAASVLGEIPPPGKRTTLSRRRRCFRV